MTVEGSTEREPHGLRAMLKKVPVLVYVYRRYRKVRALILEKRRLAAMHADGAAALKQIADILNKTDIQYFAAFGTLLGLVRDGEIIPYDPDIDLGIIKTESFTWEKLLTVLKAGGFDLRHYFVIAGNVIEVCVEYINNPLIKVDFFLFEKNEGVYLTNYLYRKTGYGYESSNQRHIRQAAFPYFSEFCEMDYHGVPMRIPRNYEELLEAGYTKDWRTPDPNWNSGQDPPNAKELADVLGMCMKATEWQAEENA